MAVANSLSEARSYGTMRSRAWLAGAAKSLIQAGVSLAPRSAFRLAAYIQSLERAQATRTDRSAAAEPPLESFEALLARADPSIDHVAVLELLKAADQLREDTLHRYLTTTFLARRLDRMERALAFSDFGHPETHLFHSLRLQQYGGRVAVCSADILTAFQRLRANPLHSEGAANLCADLLARQGDVTALLGFIEQLSPIELTRLSQPTFLGLLRLLSETGEPSRLAWLRSTYLGSLPTEQQLYFLELLPQAEQVGLAGGRVTWRRVLDRFGQLYSASDASDRDAFERCVVAPLATLPASTGDCLNIRFDAAERQRLQALMMSALRDGRGLSLVRLGDGEAYGYDHGGLDIARPKLFRDDNETRERMWWGHNPDETTRDTIKRRFRDSIAGADIIGIPSVYRMIRDRGPSGSPFGKLGGQRGLAVVLSKLGKEIPVEGRVFTEERCNQILFNRETIEALSGRSNRVVLVSCWTSDQLALRTSVPVHDVVIPGHTKVAKATGMGAGMPALFLTFDEQIAAMEQRCAPGVLVLVGAGFLGKIFIAAARAKGAVALDVGAVLDYMAGFKTRSLADLG